MIIERIKLCAGLSETSGKSIKQEFLIFLVTAQAFLNYSKNCRNKKYFNNFVIEKKSIINLISI